jgi:hypothetical protein
MSKAKCARCRKDKAKVSPYLPECSLVPLLFLSLGSQCSVVLDVLELTRETVPAITASTTSSM